MSPQPQPATISDRFLAVIQPKKPARRAVEDDQYLAMMWRLVRALEVRTVSNPELLPQCIALAQRLAELVNVAVAANAERYAVDQRLGASMMECARILGISKQSASERKARGVAVMSERIDRAGAVRFAEAKREREAIEAAAAHAAAALESERAEELREYRARHLRVA